MWQVLSGPGFEVQAYVHSVLFSRHVFLHSTPSAFTAFRTPPWRVGITSVWKPTSTKQPIANVAKRAKLSRANNGATYLPGIVGLSNIQANDYASPGLQALSTAPPLQNYFLEEDNCKNIKRPPRDGMPLLVQRFGEPMRKLWNPGNFKAHVSPHEMLLSFAQETFQITKQGDGVDCLSWFLSALHSALVGEGGFSKGPWGSSKRAAASE